jgi:hypothetical protein
LEETSDSSVDVHLDMKGCIEMLEEPPQFDPESVLLQFLSWIGVPALIIALISIFLQLLAWKSVALTVVDRTKSLTLSNKSSGWTGLSFIPVFLAQGLTLACAYSLTQLFAVPATVGLTNAPNSAGGLRDVLASAITYSEWSGPSRVAVGTLAAIFLTTNVLIFFEQIGFLELVRRACALAGLMLAAGGLVCLLLGLITVGYDSKPDQEAASSAFALSILMVTAAVGVWMSGKIPYSIVAEGIDSDPYSPRRRPGRPFSDGY